MTRAATTGATIDRVDGLRAREAVEACTPATSATCFNVTLRRVAFEAGSFFRSPRGMVWCQLLDTVQGRDIKPANFWITTNCKIQF